MRSLFILLLSWCLCHTSSDAQYSWMGGGVWSASSRYRNTPGAIGLQVAWDHYWHVGFSRPVWKRNPSLRVGVSASFQFRSIFYELDRSLPYYPLKSLVPAFQLESVQLNPFLAWEKRIGESSPFGWSLRTGPVFSFHGGDYSSVTTARTVPGAVPFNLYRLGVYRQPMGMPFLRTQVGFSYWHKLGGNHRWGIHPFFQFDLSDRSCVRYEVVPDDPDHRATGWLRPSIGSFGISCSITRVR